MLCFGKGELRHIFLSNLPYDDCSAPGILSVIENYLETKNLPLSCCSSSGTDGSSVMWGEHVGVGALLRERNPFTIDIHCLARKLALAASQVADEVTYMKKHSKCVSAIFFQ